MSITPLVLVLARGVLFAFYRLERWKERHDRSPLFEFGQLRHRGFRYGLITTSVLAMGQLGLFFVLPVFLQDAKHLSAETNGLWMLPAGVFIIVGSQIGGRLTRHVGVTRVVQLGLVLEVIGIVVDRVRGEPVGSRSSTCSLGWGLFGFGIGFAELAAHQRDPLRHPGREVRRRQRRPTPPCARSVPRSASR